MSGCTCHMFAVVTINGNFEAKRTTPDHAFTLIVSSVGIGGALVGIVIGHFPTRSSQHEQWRRDNRKQEYRELLSCLSDTYLHKVRYGSGGGWPDEAGAC
jgi:hypothetical protein